MNELFTDDFFKQKPTIQRRSVSFYEPQIKVINDIAEKANISFSKVIRDIIDNYSALKKIALTEHQPTPK